MGLDRKVHKKNIDMKNKNERENNTNSRQIMKWYLMQTKLKHEQINTDNI